MFATAEAYLKDMHVEYGFVFNVAENATNHWGHTAQKARETQSRIVAMACAHARSTDAARGLNIVIRMSARVRPAAESVCKVRRSI
jgi:hypothetical protein